MKTILILIASVMLLIASHTATDSALFKKLKLVDGSQTHYYRLWLPYEEFEKLK